MSYTCTHPGNSGANGTVLLNCSTVTEAVKHWCILVNIQHINTAVCVINGCGLQHAHYVDKTIFYYYTYITLANPD